MLNDSPRQSAARRLIPVAAVIATLALADSAWAQPQKQVLVLYSARRDSQVAIVGERDLPRILDEGLGGGLDYYSEYIDQARFPDPRYQVAFGDFLRLKYQGQRFDLVIAMNDTAVEFVASNRASLFPDVPMVYFAGTPPAGSIANSTGVISGLNLAATLELAAALQPDTKNVFVVSGADQPDGFYERLARRQLQPFQRRFTITHFAGLPTDELQRRLATLPPHSIVYYVIVNRDGTGQNFHPLEYLDRVATFANAPVYSWVDSAMGLGIVGGSLLDQVGRTEAVASLALRVLHGERADSIPTWSPNLHVPQVDWRQLRRWGLSEARLPAGTLVKFREPTAWERYKVYIVSALAILLAQTALIAGLLIQRRRRQQAEALVRRSRAELRTSYERIRDLGARLLKAQESERSRLAGELHDDIGQQLTLLEIDLKLLGGAGPGDAHRLTDEALSRARSISRSMHDLSNRLHPARLRLIGLVAAVQGLAREMEQSDVAIAVSHENMPPTLPPDLTVGLFRIVQEALQNALKYSQAKHVSVDLRGTPDGLVLTIADDGVGFDAAAAWNKGLGMITMRERLDMFGGTLDLRSIPGAGTRIEARVPIQAVQSPDTIAV
jgi:signal transduction histidine kinase